MPRLLRRDCGVLRFPSVRHHVVDVAGPRRFLREPPYHADLILTDLLARQAKCERYEDSLAGVVIDGRSINEAFYLPESRGDLHTCELPVVDARAVATFMDCAAPLQRIPARAPAPVTRSPAEEVSSRSEARSLGEPAYHARLELLDDDLTLVSGELRTFDLEVRNLGCELWPGGMDAHPQIRVAYRWVGRGGVLEEGLRTALGTALRPGASAIVPLEVLGPATSGQHEIEIDLVHEHVRWFDTAIRARISVRAPACSARADGAAAAAAFANREPVRAPTPRSGERLRRGGR